MSLSTAKNNVTVCPTCGMSVQDPKAVRCPRCFSPLVVPTGCTGNCTRCLVAHRGCSK